jgi:hypothetical protein
MGLNTPGAQMAPTYAWKKGKKHRAKKKEEDNGTHAVSPL